MKGPKPCYACRGQGWLVYHKALFLCSSAPKKQTCSVCKGAKVLIR